MPITDANFVGFLTGLGGKAITKQSGGEELPQNADLMTRIALQRDLFIGAKQTDAFIADMLGDDWKQLTNGKKGDLDYLSRRPSAPAGIIKGMLLNRGVSLTQAINGNYDPEIKRQVSEEFREACSDPAKMGKLMAEALKGIAAFDINREMRDALGDQSLTPGEVTAMMGSQAGGVLNAVYMAAFRNLAQEMKQFGEHVMHAKVEGAFFSKNDVPGHLGPMGDAFLSDISDADLAAYHRMTRLADSLGSDKTGPEMLIGYYTSRFYDPTLAEFSNVVKYDYQAQSPSVNAQRAVFGAIMAKDIAIRMSMAGRAGNVGYPTRDFLLEPFKALEGRFNSAAEVNALLADPVQNMRLRNELLDAPDRMEKEIAIAHANLDWVPKYCMYQSEAGLKTAFSSFISEIPEDRLNAELSKPWLAQEHPFNLGSYSESDRSKYIKLRTEWRSKLQEEMQRLEKEIQSATDEERKSEYREQLERCRSRADRLGREAGIAQRFVDMDNPGFDMTKLLDEPEIRPELKAALVEKGRIWALVTDECQKICEKEGNGRSFNDFYDADNRDMAYLCTIPDSITDDEARRAYVRDWVRQWNDKPEGRKKCLDAFYDRQDGISAKDPDLSCLTEADESDMLPDGLTQSEHDLMDMLYLRSSSQTAVHEGPTLNPAYFAARYGSDTAIEVFNALKGAKMGGLDIYLNQVMSNNGLEADALKPAERGRIGGYTAATMRNMAIASQRSKREIAAAFGKTPSDVSECSFIFNAEYMGQPGYDELEAEKSAIVALIDKHQKGEALSDTEIYTASSLFEANIGSVAGYGSTEYEKKRKDFDVDLIDTIFVDGKPLREYVGDKYGDPSNMNEAQRQALGQKYMAEAAMAAMSGEHRVEYAEILKDKEGKPLVNLVSVKMDMHALDAAENKAHHNAGRRAFNFGLTKLETRADKADRLWAEDPDKETRKAFAAAALYQKASRNRAATALKAELEGNQHEARVRTEAQKAQDKAAKQAHDAAIVQSSPTSFKPTTVAEYEAVMVREFTSLSTPREKAQMLLGLAVARYSGGMNPVEAEAANNFMVMGLLDRQPGGSVFPNGTREIFREIAKMQAESQLAMSAAYTERLAFYGSTPGAEAKAMHDVMMMPESYEQIILESFSPERVMTLIDPKKLSGEAADKYRKTMTGPCEAFPDGFITAASQVYEQEKGFIAAAQTEAQKSTMSRMDEAMEPHMLEAAGISEDDLEAQHAAVQGKVAEKSTEYASYRYHLSEQFVLDAAEIYDAATMAALVNTVKELPVFNKDRWLLSELGKLNEALGAEGAAKTVTPQLREAIADIMADASELTAKLSPEERRMIREAYTNAREQLALVKRIADQPLKETMERLKDTQDVYDMDQLYYRMTAEDKAAKHENSPEYEAMYRAVEAVHKAAATYDPKDMTSRAAMAEMMERVHETSKIYAEAEAYKKKNSDMGVARKNSALMALSISSAGKEPELKRIKDLRVSRKEKAQPGPESLMAKLFADCAAKYGAVAKNARDAELVATSVDRQRAAADALTREQKAAYQRGKRHDVQALFRKLAIRNDANVPAFFGLDSSLFSTSGLANGAALPADAPEDKKRLLTALGGLMEVKSSAAAGGQIANGEICRGAFGGVRVIAMLSVYNDLKEKGIDVSLADVLDPDKFVKEKQEWAVKVVDALTAARQDEPDSKELGKIIGTCIRTLNNMDPKAETLKALGYPADLPEDKALAVLSDKKNLTTVATMLRIQGDMVVSAYQAMDSPAVSAGKINWSEVDFSKKDPQTGRLTPDAVKGCIENGQVSPEMLTLIQQVADAAGEVEMAKFAYTRFSSNSLVLARFMTEYLSGENRRFKNGDSYAASDAMAIEAPYSMLLEAVAKSSSFADPELSNRTMAYAKKKRTQLGETALGKDAIDAEGLIYADGMTEDQKKRLKEQLPALVATHEAATKNIDKELLEHFEEILHIAEESEAKKQAAPVAEAEAPVVEAPSPEVPEAPKAPEAPATEGIDFLSSITGLDATKLSNYEDFYHALDNIYINGLSAMEYFKEKNPELHIDDEYDPLAIGAEEKVGRMLKAFVDAAKQTEDAAVFIAVEDANGLLKPVEASADGLDAKSAAMVTEYNRIAGQMYDDMNKVRLQALESYRKNKEAAAASPAAVSADKPAAEPAKTESVTDKQKATMEAAVNVSEGKHRKVAGGLSGLEKMDKSLPKKPDYAALAAARRQAQKQQAGPTIGSHRPGGPK